MEGYEFKTTFWFDFGIADVYGADAVRDTFNRAFSEWKNNYIYLTELSLILNWKLWQHHENKNVELAKLYNEIWLYVDDYAKETLKDKELSYYYETTD